MKNLNLLLVILSGLISPPVLSQDANSILQKIKDKLNKVNDYEATGIMKTNVSFLRVPEANVTVFFKKPDHMKIKNDKGISLVPKGAISLSLNNLLKGDFTVVDAGSGVLQQRKVKIIKLLPLDENADMVLSTLFIDETRLLILKAKTTTKEHGSYEVEMSYGKYENYSLPDKVLLSFNTKDYKLPEGVTFDYDDGGKKKTQRALNDDKGQVEIIYSSYIINKGLSDAVFR